jgi:hypothetical protein
MAFLLYQRALVFLRPYFSLWDRGHGVAEVLKMLKMVEMIVLQVLMVFVGLLILVALLCVPV